MHFILSFECIVVFLHQHLQQCNLYLHKAILQRGNRVIFTYAIVPPFPARFRAKNEYFQEPGEEHSHLVTGLNNSLVSDGEQGKKFWI